MARQIVPDKNGKTYSMWSTIADAFIAKGLTKEEYIECRAKEAYEDKKEEMEGIFKDREEMKSGLIDLGFRTRDDCAEILRAGRECERDSRYE